MTPTEPVEQLVAGRSRWQRFRFWLTHRCLFPFPAREGQRWKCRECGATYEVEWVPDLTAVGNDAMADVGGREWVHV